ncbi:MAG: hypothetical protein V1728_01065 [Candidatus Micrarchaeota archaeon]
MLDGMENQAQSIAWEHNVPILESGFPGLGPKSAAGEMAEVIEAPQKLKRPKEPRPIEKAEGFFGAWESESPYLWENIGAAERSANKIGRVYRIAVMIAQIKASGKRA